MSERVLYCCGCESDVNPRLTNGAEIYPHRKDLHQLPFWKCDECGNYVGCHHKTSNPTLPLGAIPTPEIKNARRHVHRVLDPIWKDGHMNRGVLYEALSDLVGWKYHTADLVDIEQARAVYSFCRKLLREFEDGVRAD